VGHYLEKLLKWLGFGTDKRDSVCADSGSSIEFLESCDDFLEWVNNPTTSIADLENYGKDTPTTLDKAPTFPPNPSKGQIYHCPAEGRRYIWMETESSSNWVPLLDQTCVSPLGSLVQGSGGAGGAGGAEGAAGVELAYTPWNYLPPTKAVTIPMHESGDSNHPPFGSYINGSSWVHPSLVDSPRLVLVVEKGKWRIHGQDGALSVSMLESYLRLYPNTRFNTYLTDTQIRDAVKLLLLNTFNGSTRSYYNNLTLEFVIGNGDKTLCLPKESLHDMTPSLFVEEVEKAQVEKGVRLRPLSYEKWSKCLNLLTTFGMPFTLPIDPGFRKEVIESWIEDIYDRLDLGDVESAKKSWEVANKLYLSLPPGQGDFFIEERLSEARVKLER
jgi:hypothetical protein